MSPIVVTPLAPLKSRLIFASVLLFIAFAISVIVVFVIPPLTLSVYVPAERVDSFVESSEKFIVSVLLLLSVTVTLFVFPVVGADCCKSVGNVALPVIAIKSAPQVKEVKRPLFDASFVPNAIMYGL